MYDSIKGRHLVIFGFSFKKDTGDTRDSHAITVCKYLLNEGAILHIFDPKVTTERICEDLVGLLSQIVVENDPYQACLDSEAIILLSAWDIFKTLDYTRIYMKME